MKLKERLPALAVMVVLAGGGAAIVWNFVTSSGNDESISVKVPKLSAVAAQGQRAFEANCAECHGTNGAGTDQGPPFVHDIYNPGHHGDIAFVLAARQGVQRHHWRFGNMPSQPQVTDQDIALIVRYVRELQEANGIFYRPHRM